MPKCSRFGASIKAKTQIFSFISLTTRDLLSLFNPNSFLSLLLKTQKKEEPSSCSSSPPYFTVPTQNPVAFRRQHRRLKTRIDLSQHHSIPLSLLYPKIQMASPKSSPNSTNLRETVSPKKLSISLYGRLIEVKTLPKLPFSLLPLSTPFDLHETA